MSAATPQKTLPKSYRMDDLLVDDLSAAARLASVDLNALGLSDDVRVISKHYNKPQMRSMLVGANEEYAVWGRGTGKSEGLIAPKTFRNVEVMPRSHGCFVGATYLQLLERTLPPVIKGWEQMGMVRGRDFWIRERPPKKLGIKQPIVGPLTAEHCIFFKNGAVASMVSQDRPGSANGKTVHWIAGDEAKFLDKPKLDNELLMTNRGDERFFGGIPEFHSLLFCTDMPTSKSAMWILEEEKRMKQQWKDLGFDRIQFILSIRANIYALYEKLLVYPARRGAILQEIAALQTQWNKARINTVFFSEASTLDNIHGFGAKNIARLREKLPPFIFDTAILNRRPFLSENPFYPDLDDCHFYDLIDYGFVNSLNTDQFGKGLLDDSRKDLDVDKYRPLDVALDYGAKINTLVVGQPSGREYRLLKELYVRTPERVQDLARLFCRYYRHHPTRTVNYFYDHTAIGTSPISDVSAMEVFADYLGREGWNVEHQYIGHTPTPEHRYELWGRALRGGDAQIYRAMFNRENTEFLRISMQQAQIKQGSQRFEKDKSDEKNLSLDQRETTHFSDAVDTLLTGAHMLHKFGSSGDTFDSLFGR